LKQPTVIDNVETYACATRILQAGAPWFLNLGTKQSSGTKLVCVSGDCPRPGVYEVPFGITVNALLDLIGVNDAGYVQMSGPSGEAIAPKDFGRTIAYEDLSTGGSTMIFNQSRDVLDIALQFADFFVDESCGWCAPCRVGTQLLKRELEKIVAGRATLGDIRAIDFSCANRRAHEPLRPRTDRPQPILTTLKNFPESYEARLRPELFVPAVDLQIALRDAVSVQGREPVAQRG